MSDHFHRGLILNLCMFDSIHTARWLGQFKDEDIDFKILPSSPHRRIHPELKRLLEGGHKATYRIVRAGKYFGLPLWILDKFTDNFFRGLLLKHFIKKYDPTIVHALELQNAGYIALRALGKRKPKGLKLIVTNWGSDIFWFQKYPKHRDKLVHLLRIADAYAAECKRDVSLAKELGFAGKMMPVIPNAGGFSEEDLSRPSLPVDQRSRIAIKGYDGWVGRAKVALEAVRKMPTELKDYDIQVYSANRSVLSLAKRVSAETGLRITAFGKGALSHRQVLGLFARSTIYVGLSESDGISTSMLEAMAMGAIPVQTSTACCEEWFKDSGVAVDEITVPAVQDAIRRALELAKDPKHAAKNLETIKRKASAEEVQKIALKFYH